MNFHSRAFAIFLVVIVVAFWALARRRGLRTALLLAGSYLFYGAYDWRFLGLIAFSTVLDWFCGGGIARSENPRRRKLLLAASLIGNLGLLGFFKYYNWGVSGAVHFFEAQGWSFPLREIEGLSVPVGISFYTFQTLSYTIDIYRRKMSPARTFGDFALFVAFFPQLVAGPIVRAIEFIPQLELRPRFDRERLHDGLFRIGLGLAKKVILADVIGAYLVDPVYGDPESYTAWMHLLAVYGFMFQIYYDFSGYSDIAIGSARLLGFDLPENFRLPYQSRSVREFWRRWHITLSFWVRDYIYFPLGGSKASEWRVRFNLMVTMLVIGLWHGASMLWVYYGLLQGVAMIVERAMEHRRGGEMFATTRGKSFLAWLFTVHFVTFSCILIRVTSIDQALGMLGRFGDRADANSWVWLALGFGAAVHFVSEERHLQLKAWLCSLPTPVVALGLGVVSGFVAFLVVGETPYIYFQF